MIQSLKNIALLAIIVCCSIAKGYGQNIPQINKNYTIQKVYDEDENIISYVQVYKDKLGRTQQVQSKDLENSRVVVQQAVFDEFGRPVIQSLPGVSYTSTTDQYLGNFMKNSSGNAFGIADFDKAHTNGNAAGEKFNPNGVSQSALQGELGWYYSNSNSQEAYVPASAFPYRQVIYSNKIQGAAAATSAAGENLKMGSGHVKKVYFMELGRELEQLTGLKEPAYKSISVDEEGLARISYANTQGNILAQCYSGIDMGPCSTQVETYSIQYANPAQLEKSFVEVHIANNSNASLRLIKNFDFVNGSLYCLNSQSADNEIEFVLEDLLTGKKLIENTDYSIASSTHVITFTGEYSDKDRFLKISLELDATYIACLKDPGGVDGDNNSAPIVKNAFPLQQVEVTTDYSSWTIYKYNNKQQLIKTYTPKYVNCWTPKTNSLTKTYEQDIETIGSAVGACPTTSLNTVSLESTSFDSYDLTSGNKGNFKFSLDLLTPILPLPSANCDPGGCNFIGTASGGLWEPGISGVLPTGTTRPDPVNVGGIIVGSADLFNGGNPFSEGEGGGEGSGEGEEEPTPEANTPCVDLDIKKRKGTFKITLLSEARNRVSGLWEPVDLLSTNYDESFHKVADDAPTSSIEYLISLNMDCACNFLLRVLQGSTAIRGIMDQSLLNVYDKVRFRFDDDIFYAPYLGDYTQYYEVLNDLSYFQTHARGIGLNFQGIFEENSLVNELAHTVSGEQSYTYNEYGQLQTQHSVDEGTVEYYYDEFHRIQFWRTAEQAANQKFSYLVYDDLGRIKERGVLNSATEPTNAIDTYVLSEQHFVTYSVNGSNFPSGFYGYEQLYSKGRVTKTSNASSSTWYGYDQRGRISWTVQEIDELNKAFSLHYTYNKAGNIATMDFQKDLPSERLIHLYSYDANERLKTVETSEDDISFTVHANYEYYQHGALKRTELGNKLQGIDYVYTINGRLKSINNPVLGTRDPGKDGETGSAHDTFAQDIFGMTLDYFRNDYVRDGTGIQSYSEHYFEFDEQTMQPILVIQASEYNGIINSVRWRTRSEVNTSATPNYEGDQLVYVPQYDERFRLESAKFGSIPSTVMGVQNTGQVLAPNQYDGPSPSMVQNYRVWDVSYDLNGNLATLNRKGYGTSGTTRNMDQLTLNRSENRLTQVTDLITAGNFTEDIDNQGLDNYTYDASGRMIGDVEENNYLTYNSTNMPLSIYSNSAKTTLKSSLLYDERGQRLLKRGYTPNFQTGGSDLSSTQYYLRDVSGNLMAILNKSEETEITEIEHVLYGATQLGYYSKGTSKSRYQLTDHLGNIRVTIGGTKVNADVELLSMQDYYPFGSKMPGRSITASSFYKQGYQGQAEDAETGFNAFELRLYDARIGGWLSPDPYKQHHSPYMAMSNNPLSFIDPDGGRDGNGQDRSEAGGGGNYDWIDHSPNRRYSGGGGGSGGGSFGSLASRTWRIANGNSSLSGSQIASLAFSYSNGTTASVMNQINRELS
ncbi:MAG: RHS repeat-associated core domain-containing protein, partial [Flavobacteriales bacterium]|nr:RHS repeat-associated core domain-containing protein [Flavobacteriales bacterium]